MMWLLIFTMLVIIELSYIWIKRNQISTIVKMSRFAFDIFKTQLKNNKNYIKGLPYKQRFFMFILLKSQNILLVTSIILLIVNAIITTILTLILNLTIL